MTGNFFLDHDRCCDVKWADILGNMGRYHPISGNIGQYLGNIGQYRAILEDNGVISSSVKFVIYWARLIQVIPDQLFFLFILSGHVGYVTLRYCSKRSISDDILNTMCIITHI